ncbi:sensor histidine kinase [Actinocatenispora rupis]|uniref:sensor histidine kinase n=1 Tax=Actinocatenispora rupis TaxID=519421 RepID=UPI0019430FB3|nr:ATP-binding protein [Actinocatenispora rupis]
MLALAGLRLTGNIREASTATDLRNLIALSQAASAVTDDLAHESVAATRHVLSTSDNGATFKQQVAVSDEAIMRYHELHHALGDVPSDIRTDLHSVDSYLGTLRGLRAAVRDRSSAGTAVALRYEVIVEALNAYRSGVAAHAGSSDAGNAIRAGALFSEAKANLSYEQTLAYAGLATGQFGPDERETFVAALHAQEQSLLSFMRTATPGQRELVTSTVAGDAVHLADRIVTQLSRADATTGDVNADDVLHSLGAMADLMRWVERQLDAGVAADITSYRNQVVDEVTVESLAVLLAIVLALLVTVLLARMMSRSLRRLGRAADTVARRDLPDAVAKLSAVGNVRSDTLPALVEGSYDPIRVHGTDEVGQVATSFNGVHREALRIALEQAILRMNVSATFVSLARRSQKLVDKMIARLDLVERDEEHPERLRDLFELDHLATRMRRNDENLLILADADAGSARLEDAGLADVLAAAQSEIARYERIQIGPLNIGGGEDEAVSIAAAAVNDVVRLFAELLENAAAFSPPSHRVMVTARRVADQVLVEIEDHGIGMTQQRRDELNAQLTADTERSLASVRMMGFAVVSKLAARHRIRVHLGAGTEGGTIVHVMLPPALIAVSIPALQRPEPGFAGWSDRDPPVPVSPVPGPVSGRHADPRADGFDDQRPGRHGDPLAVPVAPASNGHSNGQLPRRGDTPRLGPVPPPAPALTEAETTQLPVIASDGSDWFMSSTVKLPDGGRAEEPRRRPAPRPTPPRVPDPARTGEPARPATPRAEPARAARVEPASPHPGWQAAERAGRPTVDARTTGGLPKRDPMANLVPGGFEPRPTEIPRSANGVRSFLTEFQRGVASGRDHRPEPDRPPEPDPASFTSSHPNRRTGES